MGMARFVTYGPVCSNQPKALNKGINSHWELHEYIDNQYIEHSIVGAHELCSLPGAIPRHIGQQLGLGIVSADKCT